MVVGEVINPPVDLYTIFCQSSRVERRCHHACGEGYGIESARWAVIEPPGAEETDAMERGKVAFFSVDESV